MTTIVSITLTKELLDDLERVQKRYGRNRSEVIRGILAEHLGERSE